MDKKTKVVTNKRQMARLVQLMEENVDLGKGVCGKIQAKSRWEVIATELNSLGPPLRSWEKWLKVWTDFKSKTKKRFSQNRAEFRQTGGGPNNLHTFTALEETVISLLNFETVVDPPGEEFGSSHLQCPQRRGYTSPVIALEEIENEAQEAPEEPGCDEIHETANQQAMPKRKSNNREKRITLLEKQINNQEKYFETMKKNTSNIKKSLKNIEKHMKTSVALKKEALALKREKIKLEKEKLEVYKEEVLNKRKNRVDKLKLKVQLLEMEKEKVCNILM